MSCEQAIIYGLPMQDYLAHRALGSSQLKQILSSPRDFKAALGQKSEDTKATILGTAVHTAILEPEKFSDTYALQPEDWGPRNKGEGFKKWNEFKAQNEGKICLGLDEASLLERILQTCATHRALKKITSTGKAEVTAFCVHKEQELKARADWITDDGYIWDIKTTSKDMADSDLQKTVFINGYHFQAAHHLLTFRKAGLNPKGFGWVFISTQTPAVHIVTRQASKTVLDAGNYDHAFALKMLEDCKKTDNWYGFDDEVKEIELPEFAMRNYSELQTG